MVASCVGAHLADELLHLELRARVEARRRLVEQEQDRRGQQRAGERDLLLHAAGEVLHRLVAAVGREADALEDLGDRAHASRAARHAVEARGVAQVLDRRHLLEEARLDRHAVDEPPHGPRLAEGVVAEDAGSPPSGSSSVESRRTSVDLPDPFGPRMATHSPRAIVEVDALERGRRGACRGRRGGVNSLRRLWTSRAFIVAPTRRDTDSARSPKAAARAETGVSRGATSPAEGTWAGGRRASLRPIRSFG